MTISKEELNKYLESFKSKSVLIVGDVMVDSYLMGKVNRISPEAPIPVVSVTEREYRLGGAANVALNLSALGAKAYLCSVIGDDEKGRIFDELLNKRKLSNKGIIVSKNRKTTVKTRVISGGQHLLRVDDEDSHPIEIEIRERLLLKLKELVNDVHIDLIIFEDYDKGVISSELIEWVSVFAKEKNILTSVDPKKINFSSYKNITLFKPNFKEFTEGLKADINKSDLKTLEMFAQGFIKDNNIDILMITLSEKGVFIANKLQSIHFPAEVRDISDVSGAGDTVISVASLLLASDASLGEIAFISNIAGGLVCEKTGVVPINCDDLLNEFE